jgi:hypothetical protein
MEVPMKPAALVPFKFLKSLAAPHLYGVLVHVTGNNLSLVPLSPANLCQGLITGFNVTGDKFIAGNIDNGDKHSFANISANFRKKSKLPQWNTLGPERQT